MQINLSDVIMSKKSGILLLGSAGSGKSYFVKRFIAELSAVTQDGIFVCDPQGEYAPLISELNGQTVKLSQKSEVYLNPMDIPFGIEFEANEDPIAEKISFLFTFMELIANDALTSGERDLIGSCASKIYTEFYKNPSAESMPVLEDLYGALTENGAQRLISSLEPYVHGSCKILSNRTNIDLKNRLVCFDTLKIGASLQTAVMLTVMESVWTRVSQNRAVGNVSWCFCDELYPMLNNEQAMRYFLEINKRFRRCGCIPVITTQNTESLLNFSETESIADDSTFVIMFNQARNVPKVLAEKLGISEHLMEHVAHSAPGCGLVKLGEVIEPFRGIAE